MSEKSDHDCIIELNTDVKWLKEKFNALSKHLWALTIPILLMALAYLLNVAKQ